MRHKFSQTQTKTAKQRGSTLTTALFIIVFMGILLAGIMRLINVGGINTAYEVVGLRALQAAHTGIEVGLSRFYPLNSANSTSCATVIASAVTLPSQFGFDNCSVVIACSTRTNVIEGNRDLIQISSTASCTSGDFTTSRKLSIEAIEL